MRAVSLMTLESAPRFSLSAELPREAARALCWKQSCLVNLCRESRPMGLLSMAFESRSVVLDHC